jgi:hypothetical protein
MKKVMESKEKPAQPIEINWGARVYNEMGKI